MLLEEKAYDFAQKILKVYYEPINPIDKKIPSNIELEPQSENKLDPKRIIGGTDYKKFEDFAKSLDREEREKAQKEKQKRDEKRDALKMGCNNDLRKERQLMDKPVKDKIEASKIFKTEGDDLLKQKNYEEAINSYEKGLLQLFYTFSDDPEEEKEADHMKEVLNMNYSMCLIALNKFDEALGCLNEALRCNDKNIKAVYRMAYCYFKLEKFNQAIEEVDKGISMDKNNQLFIQLKRDINNRIDELEKSQNNLYKKIISNK